MIRSHVITVSILGGGERAVNWDAGIRWQHMFHCRAAVLEPVGDGQHSAGSELIPQHSLHVNQRNR